MDSSLEQCITDILKVCGLSDSKIQTDFIDNEENLLKIKRAFVDKSYDSVNNNSLFSLKGDFFVRYLLSMFIDENFPNIKSTHQYSSIMCKFQQSKNYIQIALNLKLDKYIKFNPYNNKKWTTSRQNCDFKETKEYKDICGDVFLALCHIISEILYKDGLEACYELVSACFFDLNISVDYEDIVSPITRLYEVYASIGVDLNKRSQFISVEMGSHRGDKLYERFTGNIIPKESRIIGFGYMLDGKIKKLVSVVASTTKAEAKHAVAEELLAIYAVLGLKLPTPETWVDVI